jgi:hypothetical protein
MGCLSVMGGGGFHLLVVGMPMVVLLLLLWMIEVPSCHGRCHQAS